MSDRGLVLIIGGTRGTGLLIAHLLHRDRIPVRVLARDRRRALARLGATADVVAGDITNEVTLPAAIEGVSHIVFTAGCRSGRPVREAHVRATEYQGVLNTLVAAQRTRFAGRFLYMTSSGVGTRSFLARALNVYKGNTLLWRQRAEGAIRASGIAYTIIRTGMLVNRQAGTRTITLTQRPLPLSPIHRIARADVAEAFAAALDHPRAARATFDITWQRPGRPLPWPVLMEGLEPDVPAWPSPTA